MWNIEEETGYHPITTFWEDFSVADKFGPSAVKDTYKRAMAGWKTNYKYLTELTMVLNWKIWQYYENNDSLSSLYDDIWRKTDNYAISHLKDEELSYFYSITD